MPVIDTNFLIALQDREPGALALFEEIRGEPMLLPAVVAVEYLTPYGQSIDATLQELGRAFTMAHTSNEWVAAAARRRQALKRKGQSIRTADFWISCWAALHDTYVVTRDVKDFEALGVKARTW